MDLSLHVATAGQKTLQNQLTIVANNIANANTPGFRAEIVDFKSLVSSASVDGVNFPKVANLYPSIEQGTFEKTDNPLDVAISGPGWFAIDTPGGTAYTRDGRFMINPFGELQTIEGHSVLDAGGGPIQLGNITQAPEILQDGRIYSQGRVIASLGVYDVAPENLDTRFSNSAFFASVPGVPVEVGSGSQLNQGFVEGSNVSAVHELANLITISKNYQSVSTMIGRVDEVLGRSVRELGNT
ncbi:MAG: flagellar hook-basal body complex protein [Pseudomonadota bacterium]